MTKKFELESWAKDDKKFNLIYDETKDSKF